MLLLTKTWMIYATAALASILVIVGLTIWFVKTRHHPKTAQKSAPQAAPTAGPAPVVQPVTVAPAPPTSPVAYMTDEQASVFSASLQVYHSRSSSQSERDAAALALYPLSSLSLTGPQMARYRTSGPSDVLKKNVTADYVAIQAGGHAT